MNRAQAPEALWGNGVERTDEIRQNLARKNLGWRTPLELLTGDTPYISDLFDFGYYDWVWYWYPTSAQFPAGPCQLGIWLGRDPDHGPAMCYKILKPNGHWITRYCFTPFSDSDKRDAAVKDCMTAFTTNIDDSIGKLDPSFILEEETAEFETTLSLDETQDESDQPALDVDDKDTLDPLINADIILPQGDGIALASVMERKRAQDGSSIGHRKKNPLLDSRIYIVKLPDGEMKDVGYNI
jgi:hypothetical protein